MKIRIEHLGKIYAGGKEALRDLNLEIESGMFGLLGPNGAGKTTLMRIMTLLQNPTSGTIFFDDYDLSKDRKAIRERINEVLEKVGLPDKRDKFPHQLSGGEQQRVVLARALLNAPPIILADEPTGNIDPETAYQLVELLKDICDSGKTVIIATHQYDLIHHFPGRVFRCENGTLHEDFSFALPPVIIPETEAEAEILTEIEETETEMEIKVEVSIDAEVINEPEKTPEKDKKKDDDNDSDIVGFELI